MSADADDLWRFAVAVHARAGVENACLALQDEAGADVPLLLFAAWAAARRGVVLPAETLADLDSRLVPWRETVIRPLRTVRRTMKGAPPPHRDLEAPAADLRARLKSVELEAERLALDALAAHARLDTRDSAKASETPPPREAILQALRAVVALPAAGVADSWRERHLAVLTDAALAHSPLSVADALS
ncbi:TIGR02444 family protein [Rhodospirillum rubrum]|uniref:TIGR02444 family protein n=1 Tax=Rhodospirillum rubrum TaxID=1085 RepID=UPI001908A46D|nr:TIGR02444 family protein [Rhodospirillum rubrum]MBK1664938.1 TIGR02444 family protein [Rhodospirillum rubrum]MBK1678478.1 TIGR02444 family protein [Rhodospirillum rubrum]